MIVIKDALTPDGKKRDLLIPSADEKVIDAQGLTLLPALVDPHVHFRTPGLEHKEDWESGAKAALYGGITTLFDMPNTLPPTITLERVEEKKALIQSQLKKVDIPLDFGLYLGADKHHFDEIARAKGHVVGLKIFMGSSTGDLVMDDDESLHTAFRLAAENDLLVAVHAEDEDLIRQRKALFSGRVDPQVHSEIRNDEVASLATKKAIHLSKTYQTRLFLLHIGTKKEVELIKAAKKEGVPVFAETTPHHLFLTIADYAHLGTKAQMNPPIRTQEDVAALWQALKEGTIDTIGSDHAPHTLEEKARPYPQSPSGIPGVETTLPLLLNAAHEGRLSLKQIVFSMRDRILDIFRLPQNGDYILVDLEKKQKIQDKKLKTKCGWSPYANLELTGWPVWAVVKGRAYALI